MRRESEAQAAREAEVQAAREAEENKLAEAQEAENRRRDTLVHAEGGGDRQLAEAEVAEAVQAGGRPLADPYVAPKANQDIATPDPTGTSDEPSPEPAPAAEADGPIVNEDIVVNATPDAPAPAETPTEETK